MNQSIEYNASSDLGDLGCGDLIIALAKVFEPLKVGEVMQVRALDSGALEDIPAWCRMRGHELIAMPNPNDREHYYIQKGGKSNG